MDSSGPRVCTGKNDDGSNCSTVLDEDARFCGTCGTKVPPTHPQEPPKNVCPGCQTHLPENPLKFCGNCGYRLQGATSGQGPVVQTTLASAAVPVPATAHLNAQDMTASMISNPPQLQSNSPTSSVESQGESIMVIDQGREEGFAFVEHRERSDHAGPYNNNNEMPFQTTSNQSLPTQHPLHQQPSVDPTLNVSMQQSMSRQSSMTSSQYGYLPHQYAHQRPSFTPNYPGYFHTPGTPPPPHQSTQYPHHTQAYPQHPPQNYPAPYAFPQGMPGQGFHATGAMGPGGPRMPSPAPPSSLHSSPERDFHHATATPGVGMDQSFFGGYPNVPAGGFPGGFPGGYPPFQDPRLMMQMMQMMQMQMSGMMPSMPSMPGQQQAPAGHQHSPSPAPAAPVHQESPAPAPAPAPAAPTQPTASSPASSSPESQLGESWQGVDPNWYEQSFSSPGQSMEIISSLESGSLEGPPVSTGFQSQVLMKREQEGGQEEKVREEQEASSHSVETTASDQVQDNERSEEGDSDEGEDSGAGGGASTEVAPGMSALTRHRLQQQVSTELEDPELVSVRSTGTHERGIPQAHSIPEGNNTPPDEERSHLSSGEQQQQDEQQLQQEFSPTVNLTHEQELQLRQHHQSVIEKQLHRSLQHSPKQITAVLPKIHPQQQQQHSGPHDAATEDGVAYHSYTYHRDNNKQTRNGEDHGRPVQDDEVDEICDKFEKARVVTTATTTSRHGYSSLDVGGTSSFPGEGSLSYPESGRGEGEVETEVGEEAMEVEEDDEGRVFGPRPGKVHVKTEPGLDADDISMKDNAKKSDSWQGESPGAGGREGPQSSRKSAEKSDGKPPLSRQTSRERRREAHTQSLNIKIEQREIFPRNAVQTTKAPQQQILTRSDSREERRAAGRDAVKEEEDKYYDASSDPDSHSSLPHAAERENQSHEPASPTTEKDPLSSSYHVYNKKQSEPEMYVAGKAGGKKGNKGQTQHGMVTRSKKSCTIRFHVIVSPEFKFQKKEAKIVVWFSCTFLPIYEMQFYRRLNDDSILMTCDVEVERPWLILTSQRRHRYGISKQNNEIKWEYFDGGVNGHRTICLDDVPHDFTGILHQFDGFMSKDSKHWVTKKLLSVTGTKENQEKALVVKSLKEMLPSWQNFQANEFIQHVERVYKCMHDWPLLNYNFTAKRESFGKALHLMAQERLAELVGMKKVRGDVLASVLCLLNLSERYDFTFAEKEIQSILQLLLVQPVDNACRDVEELYEKHFLREKCDLGNCMARFFRKAVERLGDDITVLNCVPLIHFLKGYSKPYSVPDICLSDRHEDAVWWGIKDIVAPVEDLKKGLQNRIIGTVTKYLESVKHLFCVDMLFGRTVLAALSAKHIEIAAECTEVPIDALLAMVSYHFKMKHVEEYDVKKVIGCLRVRVSSEEPTYKPMQKHRKSCQHLLKHWGIAASAGTDTLDNLVSFSFNVRNDSPNFHMYVIDAIGVIEMVLRTYWNLHKEYKKLFSCDPPRSTHEDLEHDLINYSSMWVRQSIRKIEKDYQSNVHCKRTKEIEIWSGILNINFLSDQETQVWQETFMLELRNRTLEIPKEDVLAIYIYSIKPKEHHPALVDHFTECAFAVAEAQWAQGGDLFKHGASSQVVRLLDNVLLKSWPKCDDGRNYEMDEGEVIEHVLKTPSFGKLLNMYQTTKEALTTQSKLIIEDTVRVLSGMLQHLETGDITLQRLSLVIQNDEAFISCVEGAHIFTRETPTRESLKQLIHIRQLEMEEFSDHRKQVRTLANLCGNINYVDTTVLDGKLGNEVWFRTVNETITEQQSPQVKTYGFFQLPVEFQEILPVLHVLYDSRVFVKIWKFFGQSFADRKSARGGGSVLSLADVVKDVWPPTHVYWLKMQDKMLDGSITVAHVNKWFIHFDEMRLKEEVMKMLPPNSEAVVKTRLEELARFKCIRRYQDAAQELLVVRDELSLTGDFSLMERIHDACQDVRAVLSSMTEDVLTAGESLDAMQQDHIHAMQVFRSSGPLLEWIRKYVPRLEELKVLVDLGLIAAHGQSDLEVTKVTCLNDAIHGFGPLIYDLPQDAGFEEFFRLFRTIWPVLETDPALPTKLADVNAELEWYKRLKDAQGDVEVNSLKQVDAINNHGIYILNGHKSQSLKKLEDMISVEVPPKERARGVRNEVYTYSDLKELQGKLMLVAGKADKGKKDVDRFVEVFDGVCSLANTFIRICTAGSILFQDWSAKFYCDSTKPVNAFIDFSLSKNKLSGRSEDADVAHQITQIRDFMEKCLTEWRSYVATKRKEYEELNHYTTEQLVTLRSEVAKLTGKDPELPAPKVLALLHDVCPNCISKNLLDAVKSAKKVIKDKKAQHEHRKAEKQEEKEGEEDPVIALLLKEGYSRRTIDYVISVYGMEDVDEMEWKCQERKEIEDEMDLEEDVEEEDNMIFLQSDISLGRMADEYLHQLCRQKSKLKDKLEGLWEQFLSSATMSVADYLSVEHLGIILNQLSNRPALHRTLPTYLKEGQPNLIVCPARDVLATVLSAYMADLETDLPMPTREEVLLCTEDTGPEEVELLLWRAVQDKSGRIYMIVNIGELRYDVAVEVEKAVERRTQGETGYRLVLVCNAERQDRSLLVAALDHHRVHNPGLQPIDTIKNYIHINLAGAQENMFVDPQNRSVRVVRSDRAGNGKTLWKERKLSELEKLLGVPTHEISVSLPLHGRAASVLSLLQALLPHSKPVEDNVPRLFHIDIPHEMNKGVDNLLFNLVVLGSLVDQVGYVWRRSNKDFYVIEIMPLQNWEIGIKETLEVGQQLVHPILELLPTVECRSPKESLVIMNRHRQDQAPEKALWGAHDQLMDPKQFTSIPFQRVYQYLHRFQQQLNLRDVNPHTVLNDDYDCLTTLLNYCGLENPSWAELEYFIRFLSRQLQSCEESIYCSTVNEDVLPNFLLFVVRFMIQMSKDFSTRSLKMAEETAVQRGEGADEEFHTMDEISQFQLKRRWETSPHPYIFFNPDQVTMTFLGFIVNPKSMDIIDRQTGQVLEEKILSKDLYTGLKLNKVDLEEDFNELPRMRQIEKLCMVMGNNQPHEPDENYVLTSDNVKKMLAIQMRFRCKIPVIVMGETGCGKTHLIKFMCKLQVPRNSTVKNMTLMKVHGGTTEQDIVDKIAQTEELAIRNRMQFPHMLTVLFMDEVNTTEALGLVKEVLCDHSVKGRKLDPDSGLRLIAACNPYRKHKEEAIKMLEKAGLGYHVHAEETTDTLGRIPMRRLVYRVQPLPQSMLPLVWDFGQLQDDAEKLYITQIVRKKLASGVITEAAMPRNAELAITNILVQAQVFMRRQEDECSFVSLRDVERTMDVLEWFYQQHLLFTLMHHYQCKQQTRLRRRARSEAAREEDEEEEEEDEELLDLDRDEERMNPLVRSLILALGVCYYACLQAKRRDFLNHVYEFFTGEFELAQEIASMEDEINCCQDVILENMKLGENIARNQALKENVFMMVVCINLRIPLFLVGKPGSSKSLAKTIVVDNMKGNYATTPLFRSFKQVYMVSYQCSPLSTSDGIVGIWEQCAQLQKDKDLDKYAAVVVLDEVGLAEDSPRMPLKALHSLLEDGSHREEDAKAYKKVGFIGISNWSLDPAKMNRGILVQRGSPDVKELKATAIDICSSDPAIAEVIEPLMRPLAQAYSDLYDQAIADVREFFGLRDFYSLVKMVYCMAEQKRGLPSWRQLEHAILRNFGGLDTLKPVDAFRRHLDDVNIDMRPRAEDPDNSPRGLFTASLQGHGMRWESRYLLLLTENYAALPILQQTNEDMKDAVIIFGSSFPKDQEYTVVCRNINRIKICMETGQKVILLNLENLYESLYDLLNMYFSYFGDARLVDLGLGTHRIKSRVKEGFKIIVVAEKEDVYKKFPIPLINRLEKHFVAMSTILTDRQKYIVTRLDRWARRFSQPMMTNTRTTGPRQTLSDLFIGYHPDTLASVVSHVCLTTAGYSDDDDDDDNEELENRVLESAQLALLQCATPETVIRMSQVSLVSNEPVLEAYWRRQQHESLLEYMQVHLIDGAAGNNTFLQVTTHSNLLSNKNMIDINNRVQKMGLLLRNTSLQAFNTEQQFSYLMSHYFTRDSKQDQVLIIQCEAGDENSDLVACSRYIIHDEYSQAQQNPDTLPSTRRHVILIIKLPRVCGGCFSGFEGGIWESIHLDDLRESKHCMPPVHTLTQHTVSSLIGSALARDKPEAGDAQGHSCDIDFDHLIKLSIHGAAGMVRNDSDPRGSTALIKDMMDLFTSPEGVGVIEVIKERIYLLLKNKEETIMTKDMALKWLTRDVASVQAINQAGTFRQSLWLYLESKVTPMLAGLLAFINTNNNLRLITSPDQRPWIRRMWLSMLADPHICQLDYEDLRSKKDKVELTEMVVKVMGAHGTRMNSRLPFSWIVRDQVTRLIDQHIQRDYQFGGVRLIKEVGRLLKQSHIWAVVAVAFRDAGKEAVEELYLDDFVRMVHHPKTKQPEDEYQLVKQAIKATMTTLRLHQEEENPAAPGAAEWGEFGCVENIIPLVHICQRAIHTRLQIFSQVLVYHPPTIDALMHFTLTGQEHPLSTSSEMVLDVLAVHLVVKTVEPNKGLLKDQKESRGWQEQVEKLTPLVNDVLARSDRDVDESGLGSYGFVCQDSLGDIKANWNRVHAVKLFADIVCPRGSDEEKNITKMCPKLWEKLAEPNFKSEKTISNIKDNLKLNIKMVCRQIARTVRECETCHEQMLRTVLLSCGDAVCSDCLHQLQTTGDYTCLTCKQPYEQDNQIPQSEEQETIDRINKLRHLCNTFFVEIVTRMCFEGNTPPEDAVVNMLMEYVTGRRPQDKDTEQQPQPMPIKTKQINLFNDNLDPNPVIRSVLLQLLLRSSVDSVRGHINEFFNMAQEITSGESQLQLGQIYTQCLEDHYFNSVNNEEDKEYQIIITSTMLREITEVTEADLAEEDNATVRKLERIAKTRFGLGFVADKMYAMFIEGHQPGNHGNVHQLFEGAREVCAMEEAVSYLMRIIVRRYGMDALHQIAAVEGLAWVIPEQARPSEDDARPDLFVVCGATYKQLREVLAQCILDENVQALAEQTAGGLQNARAASAFTLAVFREITSCYVSDNPRKHPKEQIIEQMRDLIRAIPNFENKELAQILLTNSMGQGCPQLRVTPHTNNKHKVMTEIVTHFGVTMSTMPAHGGMASLFRDIVGNPNAVRGMFLPTMPQDMRAELYQAVLNREGRATLFECPNGHPYIIGECGGAVTERTCPTCGARIGGLGYKLADNNKKIASIQDATKPGYVLGDPANRSNVPDAERDLSAAATALLRLLLHLAMFAGANTQPDGISGLIDPTIDVGAVAGFLWQHLECDLKVVEKAVGKSADDCVLLIHMLINQLSLGQPPPGQPPVQLVNKELRRTWENHFAAAYITPLLRDLDERLQEANALVANDKRLGNNPLLKIIHETETTGAGAEVGEVAHIVASPVMWRYRARVTLEHLGKELAERITHLQQLTQPLAFQHKLNLNKLKCLELFLKKEQLIRVIQLLPNIVHLVRCASQYYHRKIGRDEANQITIEDFISKQRPEHRRKEVQEWFRDYVTAWTAVHPQLTTHVVSNQVLPEKYCNIVMSQDSPISTLLPNLRGYGFCSIALLHYLTTQHNNFMQDFCRMSFCQGGPRIGLVDVNATHMITYHLERDLLQLVSAHCNYSLEVGHGTRIEYNYYSLEQQLKERFISGKATLDYQLEPVVFCEDLSNAMQFEILDKKIKQVPLTPAVQAQIRGDVRYMAEITECLSSLDITIGFLVTVGGEPETTLQAFMTETLQMDDAVLTPKARQLCRLHHTRALWLLLSFEREKLVARYKQEPFTSVDVGAYRDELSDDQQVELNAALQHVTCDVFLAELYECIILHLTIKRNRDDEDFVDNTKQELRTVLSIYLESKDGPDIPALTNGTFPASILANQCVAAWRAVYTYILKNGERY